MDGIVAIDNHDVICVAMKCTIKYKVFDRTPYLMYVTVEFPNDN